MSNLGPYLWYRFYTLARVSKTYPRNGFNTRFYLLYKGRKQKKFRGSLWLEERYRDELNLIDTFWTIRPYREPEEYFKLPAYHQSYVGVTWRRKPKKLTNSYQIRRNLQRLNTR